MTRFDFLHDAEPDVFARIRSLRVAKPLHWPLAVLLTVMLTHATAGVLLNRAVASAEATEREAEHRFDASRSAVASVHLQRVRLNELIALDVRLRQIRRSGNRASASLAAVANDVPAHVWLTTLSRTPAGFEIVGRSSGLPALGATMSRLVTNPTLADPTLIRADSEQQGRTIAFDIKAAEHR